MSTDQTDATERKFVPLDTRDKLENYFGRHNYDWYLFCYAISGNKAFIFECYRSLRMAKEPIPEWILEYIDSSAKGILDDSRTPSDLSKALGLSSMKELGTSRSRTLRWASAYRIFLRMIALKGRKQYPALWKHLRHLTPEQMEELKNPHTPKSYTKSEAYAEIAEMLKKDEGGVEKDIRNIARALDKFEGV